MADTQNINMEDEYKESEIPMNENEKLSQEEIERYTKPINIPPYKPQEQEEERDNVDLVEFRAQAIEHFKNDLQRMKDKGVDMNSREVKNLIKFQNHQIKMIDDQIAKQNPQEPPKSRSEIKNEIAEINHEIDQLQARADREFAIAIMNGMDKDKAKEWQKTTQKIAKRTHDATELKAQMPTIREQIVMDFKEVAAKMQNVLNKMEQTINDKIKLGKDTITRTINMAQEANEKVINKVNAERDTIYADLQVNLNKNHMTYLSRSYALDRSLKGRMDKTIAFLEKSYTKKEEIKHAFKNLGRAFTGKQQEQMQTPQFTSKQQAVIAFFEKHSNNLQNEMNELRKEFNLTRDSLLVDIRSAQELRQNAELKRSETLNHKESILSKSSVDIPFDKYLKQTKDRFKERQAKMPKQPIQSKSQGLER